MTLFALFAFRCPHGIEGRQKSALALVDLINREEVQVGNSQRRHLQVKTGLFAFHFHHSMVGTKKKGF